MGSRRRSSAAAPLRRRPSRARCPCWRVGSGRVPGSAPRTRPDSPWAHGRRAGRRARTRPRSTRCARRSRAATCTRSTSSSTSRRRSTGTRRARRRARVVRGRCTRGLSRRRLDDRLGLAGALPRAPWRRPLQTMPIKGTRPLGGEGFAERREGSCRARDDRRPRAQRPLSRLRARQRSLARADDRARACRRRAPRLRRSRARCGPTSVSPSCSRRPFPAVPSPARRRSPPSTTSRDRAGRPGRLDGRARPHLAERRPRARADDPHVCGRRGQLHLWVGGGIVWDSEPEAEVDESWVKASPLLDALKVPVA